MNTGSFYNGKFKKFVYTITYENKKNNNYYFI